MDTQNQRTTSLFRIIGLSLASALCLLADATSDLIVNKYQFAGDSSTIGTTKTCISQNADPQKGTNVTSCVNAANTVEGGVGLPVLYVITISNSNPVTNTAVTVYETVPPDFAYVPQIQISSCLAGVCTAPSNYSSFLGSFPPGIPTALGPFTIAQNDVVVLYILGYYKASGSKTNFVSAIKTDQPGDCLGNRTNCSAVNLNILNNNILTDLEVTKCIFEGGKCAATNPTTTTSGATVTYRVIVTNNGPDHDIYPANLIEVLDTISNNSSFPVNFTLSGLSCTSSCSFFSTSSTSGTLNPFDNTNPIITLSAGISIPPGNSVTISFNATFDYESCVDGVISNRVALSYSNGHTTISDFNAANNTTSQKPTGVTLKASTAVCAPSVMVSKRVVSPVGQLPWSTTGAVNNQVTYEITVTPTGLVNGVVITDSISKIPGTPVFSANVIGTPSCLPSVCGTFSLFTPTVNSNNIQHQLFTVTLGSFSVPVKITYTVEYDPQCETNPGPDLISNDVAFEFGAAKGRASIPVFPMELAPCQFSVCKVNFDDTINPAASAADCNNPGSLPQASLTYPDTKVFTIFFQNRENTPFAVGTVRDVLSINDNGGDYGKLSVGYSYSCNFLPPNTLGSPPLNFSSTGLATVQYNNPLWAGIVAINLPSTNFPAQSTLMCKLTVTTTSAGPTGCQDAGLPTLTDSAFMDLSTNFQFRAGTSEDPPTAFGQASMYLPLCQNVSVKKTGTTSVGVGQPASFVITAENNQPNDVLGFTVTDTLPAGFVYSGGATCAPTPCTVTASTTLGVTTLQVTYSKIPAGSPPTNQATLTFSATAPSAAGTFTNMAKGTFAPPNCSSSAPCNPAGFFSKASLVSNLNGQVLAPKITKALSTSPVAMGVPTTLTFTVTNINGDPPQSGMGFSDTLPPGLFYVPGTYSSTCQGNASFSSGLQPATITFTNGVLTSPTCTITVQVMASACGTFTNNQSNITVTNLDASGLIPARLQVQCDAFVEVCKGSLESSPVTGSFTFASPAFVTLPGSSVTVPVGSCSGPIPVAHGPVTIMETLPANVNLSSVVASGYNPATFTTENRLLSAPMNLAAGIATVNAVAGDVSVETVALFTNQSLTGQLKLCKAAGRGVSVGAGPFSITATGAAGSRTHFLLAGPAAAGGYCMIDSRAFPVGSTVTVTENLPMLSPYVVSSAVSPGGTTGGRSVIATIGKGFTVVTFTNSGFYILDPGSTGFDCGLGCEVITWHSNVSGLANTLRITVDSGAPAAFTATASVTSGPPNWLTVSSSGSTAPATLTLSAIPLPVGAYSGAIRIASTDGAMVLTVPVNYSVAFPAPVLKISQAHQGNFAQGDANAVYTITVSNTGAGPTVGLVTVRDVEPDNPPPGGLSFASMSGRGWDCTVRATCTRTDALQPGASYPPISLIVSVPSNASSEWINRVTVSGGGSAAATASDVTKIVQSPPRISAAVVASRAELRCWRRTPGWR